MKPEEKLVPFILAAKAVIYDAKRAAPLLAMLATKSGAITAVHTVSGAIEQKNPIPPEVVPILGVSILMLLLDVMKQVTGQQPPKEMMAQVIKSLLAEIQPGQKQAAQPKAQSPTPQPPAQPAGLINQGA